MFNESGYQPPKQTTEFHKSTERINYREIDSGIRGLIENLNKLPFISTDSSCEGHLLKHFVYPKLFPKQNHSFIKGGSLIYFIDEKHSQASIFTKMVEEIVDKYSFIHFGVHDCGEKDCTIEGAQTIRLDHTDLTNAELIDKDDSVETIMRKRFETPTRIGQQRIKHFQHFWRELNDLVKSFLRK